MSDHGHHDGKMAAGLGGVVWFIGWLFTIGFVQAGMVENYYSARALAVLSGCSGKITIRNRVNSNNCDRI